MGRRPSRKEMQDALNARKAAATAAQKTATASFTAFAKRAAKFTGGNRFLATQQPAGRAASTAKRAPAPAPGTGRASTSVRQVPAPPAETPVAPQGRTEPRDDTQQPGNAVAGDGTPPSVPENAVAGDGTPPQAQEAPPLPVPAPLPGDSAADTAGYIPMEADQLLHEVYGDYVHGNMGQHLDGGIVVDKAWQAYWRQLVAHRLTLYNVPNGKVGRRFVLTLCNLFKGVRERKWNSERPLVFVAVVLQTSPQARKAKEIRERIWKRMEHWEQGQHRLLVDDTVRTLHSQPRNNSAARKEEEKEARAFEATLHNGRLRRAMRNLCRQEGRGVLDPDEACTKTGRPVVDVLREKHPALRDVDLNRRNDGGAFEPYEELPETLPVEVTAETIEKVAHRLKGSAGPSGFDAVDLKHCLLRFGEESTALREEMASFTLWMANGSPPWAAYRALMANRLVALDKDPGVRPVGIGEIFRRLMAKVVIRVVGPQATMACGNYNLCAGLSAGIEGGVHAAVAAYDKAASDGNATDGENAAVADPPPTQRMESDDNTDNGGGNGPDPASEAVNREPNTAPTTPATQNEATPDGRTTQAGSTTTGGSPEDPFVFLAVDARNGFNEISRRAMLWTVRHLWPSGSRFVFNCYRHSGISVLRRGDHQDCYIIPSSEGCTQGDPLGMVAYGLTTVPLIKHLRELEPEVLQPWYADDGAMGGPASKVGRLMEKLQELGPLRGYYPEASKSVLVSHPVDRRAAERALSSFNFQYRDGTRYLGGFVGTAATREEWIKPQIENWVRCIEKVARVTKRCPQAGYTGMTKSLQAEWLFVQRVANTTAAEFAPISTALTEQFLPALLGSEKVPKGPVRQLFSLPVKKSGLGIPIPSECAESNFLQSRETTAVLSEGLGKNEKMDLMEYQQAYREAKAKMKSLATERMTIRQSAIIRGCSKDLQARLQRASVTGNWLSTMPNHLNSTTLSAEEFRDNLRMRYGLTPLNLPCHCDGCGANFTVTHAMSCRNGGRVINRHNDVQREWHMMCAQALKPSLVTDEPLIHSCRTTEGQVGNVPRPELRGDVAAHGFWKSGSTCIFDVRVVNTEAKSYNKKDADKVLAMHEREKQKKYEAACHERRREFTPLVFSVDGLRSVKTEAACKRLASLLSKKWSKPYSVTCAYVRSRLSVALCRTATMLLRSGRDSQARLNSAPVADGAGLGLLDLL